MLRRIIHYLQEMCNNEPTPSPTIPQPNTPRTELSDLQIRRRGSSFDEKYTTRNVYTQDDMECSICLSFINDGDKHKILKCDHIYHEDCIKNWVVYKNKQTCPMCNSFIQGMNEAIVKG